MGLVRNLKKTLSNLADKILVELSSAYIKQLAKQTLKKQDNYLSMEFSQNPLTTETPNTTIVTSSADTSEKITMKDTTEIVEHIRKWSIQRVDELDCDESEETCHNKIALMDEFYEWFNPKEEIEVVTLDQITEEEYDDFVDYMNDGIERG